MAALQLMERLGRVCKPEKFPIVQNFSDPSQPEIGDSA